MPDLGSLRSLGAQLEPPPLRDLEEVARRRARRQALVSSLVGVACLVVVALAVVTQLDQRADREPDITPSPTSTPTPTPERTVEATGAPTHASDTSMTPREVVSKPNADLVLTGVSADDPDFRLAVWSAPCSWCPNDDEPRGRPRFSALVVTTDGFETATYRGLTISDSGLYHVESPGPGLLLLVDAGNTAAQSPEWLVRDDGTVTRLSTVVRDAAIDDPRRWHRCAGVDDDPADQVMPGGWCGLDPGTGTSYQRTAPWLTDRLVRDWPAASPAESDEPWGLANLETLTPYWYDGGVLHTKELGPADAIGTVSGVGPGRMAVWGLDRQSLVLTVHASSDGGRTWRARELAVPSWPERLAVHQTPTGALLALDDGDQRALDAWPTRQVWRSEPGAGGFDVVYTEPVRTDVAGEYAQAFTEVAGRIWSGGLWSDDDGRTWDAVTAWR